MRKVIVSIALVLSVVLFSDCSYAEEKGLVGCWKFDETKGETAKDFSGKGNDGTISGAVVTAGKIRQALGFDGVDDSVNCGDDSSLQVAGGIVSIAFWMNIDAYPSNDYAFVGTHGYRHGYRVCMYKTGKIVFQIGKTGGGSSHCSDSATGTGWHHIAVTYDPNIASDNMKFYLDGIADGTGDLTDPILVSTDFYIGKSGGVPYFKGIIDEVRIYNRVLTATEVANHYKMKSQAFEYSI